MNGCVLSLVLKPNFCFFFKSAGNTIEEKQHVNTRNSVMESFENVWFSGVW